MVIFFVSFSVLRRCRKIGEGVYGEVFKTVKNKLSVALKVIVIYRIILPYVTSEVLQKKLK
jgi:hypothetical protein